MNGSLLHSDAGASRGRTNDSTESSAIEHVDNIPSIILKTRRKDYLSCSKNGLSVSELWSDLSVDVETFDRQRADTSVDTSTGSNNVLVTGVDNVINYTTNGLITETN